MLLVKCAAASIGLYISQSTVLGQTGTPRGQIPHLRGPAVSGAKVTWQTMGIGRVMKRDHIISPLETAGCT